MRGSGIRDGWGVRGAWGLVGGLGLLAGVVTSCVGANADHCVYAGGDLACGPAICVLAPRGGTAPGAGDDGCFDGTEPPTGFLHAEFGLPARLEAEGDPMEVGSVEGLLRRLADGERTVSASDLEPFRGAVFEDVQRIRASITREGGVREVERELTGSEEQAVETYYEAIRAWLEQQVPGTGTGTETESETGEETATSTGETSAAECTRDEECTEAERPFCGAAGECVTCEGLPDGDGACAAKDAGLPLCVGGACVACTEERPEACEGTTPVCEAATNECVRCTEHAQCGEAACSLYTGACLPGDAVVHVGPLEEYTELGAALAEFGEEGAEVTVVVHQANYDEAVVVDGGRVVAFLANEGAVPRWILAGGGSPQLTVTGGAMVLLEGLQVSGNADDVGIRVDGGRAWVDRGRVVQNAGGGVVAENEAEVTLRSCFVGDGTNGEHGLLVNGSSANVLFTTLGVGVDNFADVFPVRCIGAVDVTIRNSLLVSFDNDSEISCSTAMVSNTASEALIPGVGNRMLGPVAADWFMDIDTGDFHLDNPPAMLDITAVWNTGDPATDIDGDPRPLVDGTPDYAGADVP